MAEDSTTQGLVDSARALGCTDSYELLGRRSNEIGRRRRRCGPALLVPLLAAVALGAGCLARHWHTVQRLRGALEVIVATSDKDLPPGQDVNGTCSSVLKDVELHTKTSIYWVSNIQNQESCCAECDAHPECRAWTFGRKEGIEGMSGRCYLKKLEDDEKPEMVPRSGVVSGLHKHVGRKHGVVAAMLAKSGEQRAEGEERGAPAGDTCVGPLSVTGHGVVSVVRATWRTPTERATAVEVPYSNWAVIPHLGSRAYFASTCTEGKYKYSEYTSLHLLGGKLRYTADLSRVGCGCNAQFRLVPMSQNMDQSACGDFSCGHGLSTPCRAICAEIAVQDANAYAWSSSLHAFDDNGGASGGYGGGADSVGRRNWTDAQYGPGGECIDTTAPFQVEVSFPVDDSGQLKSVDVTLTQEGSRCPLKLHLDKYIHKGKNGLKELTEVLRNGVTPSLAYDNSGDLRWLDGPGPDASGPCVREVPEMCPSSVRFYDFAVEQAVAWQHSQDAEEGESSPMDVAVEIVHDFAAQESRQEELAQASKEVFDVQEPCHGDCDLGTAGEDYGGGDLPGAFNQEDDGVVEWEVVDKPMHVWSSNVTETHILRDVGKSTVITGKRFGAMIKLAHQPGYVLLKRGKETFLKERRVTYKKLAQGSCAEAGLFPIVDPHVCETAAFKLGYFDTSVEAFHGDESRPEGCHLISGQLWLDANEFNKGNGAINQAEPICGSLVYPTTATTSTTRIRTGTGTTRTTATRTTTTATVFSTTTTVTWGWPSLFCVEVVRVKTYELPLVKEQQKHRASIFSCDEYAVFSDGGVSLLVGIAPDGREIKTIVIPQIKEAIGDLNHGATTNSWLNTKTFLQVWNLAKEDGRLLNHDWTVKVDPDAVFFPDRLRKHMEPHTSNGAKLFVINCNKFNPAALYGSMEVFSREAMRTYLNGQHNCRSSLQWHGWGEDFFMSHCMDHLGVGRIYDFDLLADKRCFYKPCWDKSRVVYHDFKDASPNGTWFKCWRASGGPWNPGG